MRHADFFAGSRGLAPPAWRIFFRQRPGPNRSTWSTFCEVSSTVTGTDPCPGIGYYGPLVSIQVVAGDESPTGCFVGPFSFESSPSRAYVVDWPQLYCSASYTGDQFSFWLVPLL